MRMRTDWARARVGPQVPIREALGVLDGARFGILLVTEDDGRLVGTVTDGDVRRALLRQVPLDAPVAGVMTRAFSALGAAGTTEEALHLMRERFVRQVPVLDAAGRVVGLYLLQDLAQPQVLPNWVVIMAGGEGRRLRPLTETTPKPMLPVGGRPLLERIVEHVVRQGLRDVFLSINYLGAQIRDHFGDGSAFGCRITYLEEERPLGTGGALGLLPDAPRHPFLVLNGDLVTDIDLVALLDYHAQQGNAATLCVREYEYQVPFGVVSVDGQRVVHMDEKPSRREFINAGIYALDPSLLKLLELGQPTSLPQLLDQARRHGYAVGAFPVRERWTDIGHPRDYESVRSAPP